MNIMKAIVLGSHAAVRHGILWHMADLFFSLSRGEQAQPKQAKQRRDFFEDIRFGEDSQEFDEYVKHLYD